MNTKWAWAVATDHVLKNSTHRDNNNTQYSHKHPLQRESHQNRNPKHHHVKCKHLYNPKFPPH